MLFWGDMEATSLQSLASTQNEGPYPPSVRCSFVLFVGRWVFLHGSLGGLAREGKERLEEGLAQALEDSSYGCG